MSVARHVSLLARAALLATVLAGCSSSSSPQSPPPPSPSCPEGTEGCPCAAGSCAAGLACTAGACRREQVEVPPAPGMAVGSGQVRACDVLVEVGPVTVTAIDFEGVVDGRWRQEGPRLAIAFAAKDDAPLPGTVARLRGAEGELHTFGMVSASCYDRLGKAVEDAKLTLR